MIGQVYAKRMRSNCHNALRSGVEPVQWVESIGQPWRWGGFFDPDAIEKLRLGKLYEMVK